MRCLWHVMLVALAACSRTTSRLGNDAAIDSPVVHDVRYIDVPSQDAYARRPCDAPATFADGILPSRVLHVSPGAVNGDGSSARPFGSIAAAATVATPGTFIKLAPGVHAANQFIPNLRGTPTAPIWIGGEWGTVPRILGGAEGLHLTRPAYVVIQNLEIANQTANAINIDDGVAHTTDTEAIAIVNVYAHDIAATFDSACFKVGGVNGLALYDSRTRECTRGIDLIGVHGAALARNVLYATYSRAIAVRGGSTDVDIRQNFINDGGGYALELGGVTPASQFRPALSATMPNAEARRVRAFDNFLVGDMGTAFVFNTCSDCLVAHNFTGGNPNYLIRILQDTQAQGGYTFEPTKNGRVINNSFQWMTGQLFGSVEYDAARTQAGTFTFSHNLWQAPPQLPSQEDGTVIAFSGYSALDGGHLAYCGGPEAFAAAPLPEIDGTIDGFCRADGDAPTIGPQVLRTGACRL
jgi:hypothetical protein